MVMKHFETAVIYGIQLILPFCTLSSAIFASEGNVDKNKDRVSIIKLLRLRSIIESQGCSSIHSNNHINLVLHKL